VRAPVGGARGTALVVVALGVVLATAAAAAAEQRDWQEFLSDAAEASATTSYRGEALWVMRDGEGARTLRVEVRNGSDGMVVAAPGRLDLRLDDDGGAVVDVEQGWYGALPAVEAKTDEQLALLARKYEVALEPAGHFLDRPCTAVEIRARDDGALRERLVVDDRSGLVLRRETFDGDEAEPVRLATFLSLDLRSRDGGRAGTEGGDLSSLRERTHGAEPVDERGLEALRTAGWVIPASLPGGYEVLSSYALAAADGQPLQVLYGDGLYHVSLFQQPGRPDWDALPEGRVRVEDLGWPAYEWPGMMPRRIIWEADGRTWSLVGDVPPGEMAAIAAALPQPEAEGVWQRLRRGLSRMRSAVSLWS
jgi:negative regulator of sigma E activity